jgi:hypothetical protein
VSTEYLVDIGEDTLAEQRRRRRAWRRVGVPIAGVILIAAAILGIALYAYDANRKGVLGLSDDLLEELQNRISVEVASYLQPAVRATLLAREMAASSVLGTQQDVAERLATLATAVLARTPQVDAFDFADSSGDFIMVRHGAAGGIDTKLIRNAANARQVTWIRRNAAGAEIARESDPTDTYDPRTRPWYAGALKTEGVFWTNPYIFYTEQAPGITAAIRYLDSRGNPYVFGVDISLKAISDFLASLEIGRGGRAVIIDDGGNLVAMPDVDRMIQRTDEGLSFAPIDKIGDAELTAAYDRYRVEGYGRRVVTVGGRRIVSIVAPISGAEQRWKMVIVVPEADFTGFVADNSRTTLTMSLVVIAVAAMLAILLAREGLRTDRAARLLLERSHAIGRQSEALGILAAHPDLFDPMRRAPPHALTETLADVTSARRASIWRLVEGAQTLHCEDSYDRDTDGHVEGMELSQSEVPRFFSHLATGEELEVANAAADQRAAEVHRIMMSPVGSRALFVLPVRYAGQVTGALWIEDPKRVTGTHDFLRLVANMAAIRMAAAPAEARHRESAPTAAPAVMDLGERSFSAELALRGIDVTGLAADTYPCVAVMVLKFGDAPAIAARLPDSAAMLADTIACSLQQLGSKHDIPYLKMTGCEIVAAAGWLSADATAMQRIADTALTARDLCLQLFEEAGRSPTFRIGLDCGIAMCGSVGHEPRLFNLWGEAVTTAELMASSVMPGAIQATASVHRELARDFLFRPRGSFYLPRVGSIQTFILASRL